MSTIIKIMLLSIFTGMCAAFYANTQPAALTGVATLRFPSAGWSQQDLREINTGTGSGLSGVWKNADEESVHLLCWTDFPPLLEPPVSIIAESETVVLGHIVPLRTVTDSNDTFFVVGTFEAAQYTCVVRGFNFSKEKFEQFLGTLTVNASQVILPPQ